MYNNVRDYIVSSERIGSLLRENDPAYKKTKPPADP